MPRKKKEQKEQIGVDFPELDAPELDELEQAEKPKAKQQKSTKSLDDLPAYLGKNLDGSTAADMAEWQRAKPQLSIDQLKHIYIAGHDMTLQEIADKINSISTDKNGNARYANFVLAVAAIGRGTDHANIDDLRMRFYSYLELDAAIASENTKQIEKAWKNILNTRRLIRENEKAVYTDTYNKNKYKAYCSGAK